MSGPLAAPRAATEYELNCFASAVADHTGEDVQELRQMLDAAAVAVFDNYMASGPGYVGPLASIVWDGGPGIVTTIVRRGERYEVVGSGELTGVSDPVS